MKVRARQTDLDWAHSVYRDEERRAWWRRQRWVWHVVGATIAVLLFGWVSAHVVYGFLTPEDRPAMVEQQELPTL